MDLGKALTWAATRKHGALITIRKDGRPQSSDIIYLVDGDSFLISLTDDRAKTRNIRRDPRVVLHLSHPESWSYLSFDGTVELSEITTSPHDATSDRLVEYYRAMAGEHDDWDDYRQAMINEKRLIATFTPRSVVGQIN
ncbi:MAG: PPOX class F420-dependent oxidoreductase [Acidimicrobiales bacterium]|nr:PPOX class F420-dependent oxidoreductase [Acidimicrobiales bacterium]